MKPAPEKKEVETFCPTSKKHWRQWLQKNHLTQQAVWLICYKKKTNTPTITWSDAVDEALCFGWIDSVRRPIDEEKFMQFFGKRKANSTWSKVNKEKIERLIADKQMTKAGLAVIEAAKANGSWTILDEVEELIVPTDLAKAFKSKKAKEYFTALSRSNKRMLLQWLVLAKQAETRQKRITEIVASCTLGEMPKQFRVVRKGTKSA